MCSLLSDDERDFETESNSSDSDTASICQAECDSLSSDQNELDDLPCHCESYQTPAILQYSSKVRETKEIDCYYSKIGNILDSSMISNAKKNPFSVVNMSNGETMLPGRSTSPPSIEEDSTDDLRRGFYLETEGTSRTSDSISGFDESMQLKLPQSPTSDIYLDDTGITNVNSECSLDMSRELEDSKKRYNEINTVDKNTTFRNFGPLTPNTEETKTRVLYEPREFNDVNSDVNTIDNYDRNDSYNSEKFHDVTNNRFKTETVKHKSHKLLSTTCNVDSSKKDKDKGESIRLQDPKATDFFEKDMSIKWDTHPYKQNNASKRRRPPKDDGKRHCRAEERNKSNNRSLNIASDVSQKTAHSSITENADLKKQRPRKNINKQPHSTIAKENKRKENDHHSQISAERTNKFLHVPTATMLRAKERAEVKEGHETSHATNTEENVFDCYSLQRNSSRARISLTMENREDSTLGRSVDAKTSKQEYEEASQKAIISEGGRTARSGIPMNSLLRAEARSRLVESKLKKAERENKATEIPRSKERSQINKPANTLLRGEIKWQEKEIKMNAEKNAKEGKRKRENGIDQRHKSTKKNATTILKTCSRRFTSHVSNADSKSASLAESKVRGASSTRAVSVVEKTKRIFSRGNSRSSSQLRGPAIKTITPDASAAGVAKATKAMNVCSGTHGSSRYISRIRGSAVASNTVGAGALTTASEAESVTVTDIRTTTLGRSRRSSQCSSRRSGTAIATEKNTAAKTSTTSTAATYVSSRGSSRDKSLRNKPSIIKITTEAVALANAAGATTEKAATLRSRSRRSSRSKGAENARFSTSADAAAVAYAKAATNVKLVSRRSSQCSSRRSAAVASVATSSAVSSRGGSRCSLQSIEKAVVTVVSGELKPLLDRRAAGDGGSGNAHAPRARKVTKRTQDTKPTDQETMPEINLPKKTNNRNDTAKNLKKSTTITLPPIKKAKTPQDTTRTESGNVGNARKSSAVDIQKRHSLH